MRKIAASLLAAVALLLGAAPAAAQGQVFPQTLPDHTVLGRIGSGTGSGPAQAIPFASLSPQVSTPLGVVRMQRQNATYTGQNAPWIAYDSNSQPLCTGGSSAAAVTACLHAAVALAQPNSPGTTSLGYSLDFIGGHDPASSGVTTQGNSTLLNFTGPLVFPPAFTASVRSRDISWNGTLQFDSMNTGVLDFDGGQILPSTCNACVSVDIKPSNSPAGPGGFIGFGPVKMHFSATNGQFHFVDWSGVSSSTANAINAVTLLIDELEAGAPTSGCAFLVDSPLNASQNFTENYVRIGQLNNLGNGSTGMCLGTQAPAGGAAFGRNYYDVTIEPDNGSGTAKGVDTWASGDELHIKTWQFGTGAVLTFESGACKNVAFIFSDVASPTITDSSGCTGANANIWFVNGQMFGPSVPTLGANNTWTGNNTFQTGSLLFKGPVATLTGNGQGTLGTSATFGALLGGQGSTDDVALTNKNGVVVCGVATGGTSMDCVHLTLDNPLLPGSGGTGIANSNANTITLGGAVSTAGAFTTAGAFGLTLTTTATTNSTLPAGTHTLAQLDSPTFTGTLGAATINATVAYQFAGITILDTNGSSFTRLKEPTAAATQLFAGAAGLYLAQGNLTFASNSPSISAGFCTSPSIGTPNGSAAFTVNVGSACATSTGTIGLPTATNGWTCGADDVTTPASNVVAHTGGTASTAVLTNYSRTTGAATNFNSSDVIRVRCVGY